MGWGVWGPRVSGWFPGFLGLDIHYRSEARRAKPDSRRIRFHFSVLET